MDEEAPKKGAAAAAAAAAATILLLTRTGPIEVARDEIGDDTDDLVGAADTLLHRVALAMEEIVAVEDHSGSGQDEREGVHHTHGWMESGHEGIPPRVTTERRRRATSVRSTRSQDRGSKARHRRSVNANAIRDTRRITRTPPGTHARVPETWRAANRHAAPQCVTTGQPGGEREKEHGASRRDDERVQIPHGAAIYNFNARAEHARDGRQQRNKHSPAPQRRAKGDRCRARERRNGERGGMSRARERAGPPINRTSASHSAHTHTRQQGRAGQVRMYGAITHQIGGSKRSHGYRAVLDRCKESHVSACDKFVRSGSGRQAEGLGIGNGRQKMTKRPPIAKQYSTFIHLTLGGSDGAKAARSRRVLRKGSGRQNAKPNAAARRHIGNRDQKDRVVDTSEIGNPSHTHRGRHREKQNSQAKSTVTPYGVPSSSLRAYRRPIVALESSTRAEIPARRSFAAVVVIVVIVVGGSKLLSSNAVAIHGLWCGVCEWACRTGNEPRAMAKTNRQSAYPSTSASTGYRCLERM
ncbi:hypothetical protein BKA62DRAFT_758257 [Auriculariales sp. MPI-PUGE-AT-0066]|nr:hypothetical protein BKA62DRAFT_758257 [Auriculariales sp. MPI-PUGE-AT-0066]